MSTLETNADLSRPGLSQQEMELLKKLFGSPMDFPTEFKAWLTSFIEANPPVLPISQIFGFSQFTATAAEAAGTVTTTSTSYVALSGGPDLLEVPKGKYLIGLGCDASSNPSGSSIGARMSVDTNGSGAADSRAAVSASLQADNETSVSKFFLTDLPNDVNTITSKYRSSASDNTARFLYRWIIALKYANL